MKLKRPLNAFNLAVQAHGSIGITWGQLTQKERATFTLRAEEEQRAFDKKTARIALIVGGGVRQDEIPELSEYAVALYCFEAARREKSSAPEYGRRLELQSAEKILSDEILLGEYVRKVAALDEVQRNAVLLQRDAWALGRISPEQ